MNAWIFDVDGVLSNLQTRRVSEPSLLPALAKILHQGDVVAFNTGRTTVWVEERILHPLKQLLSDPSFQEHLFLACEKGGVWQQEGHKAIIQEQFVAPSSLRDIVRKTVQDEFTDCMVFDEPKQTMISLEMREDVNMDYFQGRLAELEPILEKYLVAENLQQTFVLQKDKIAIDIQHKDAGKDIGMQHILTWLESRGHTPEHFYCFGDNPSDLHMGELLQQKKYPFTFIYVGTQPISQTSFPVIRSHKEYDHATAEELKKLLG